METRRYVFRRNGKIIGTYFARDAIKRFGISKFQISKYAHSQKLLLGIYDVSIEGKEKPEFNELTEKEWKEEWDRVTRLLRERFREMKENRIRADTAEASAFSANMLMSLYVLSDSFGLGQEQAEAFVDAMGMLEKRFEDRNISLAQIAQRVFDDYGMIIELPEVK